MINHRLVWTQGIFTVDENKIWFVPYWINVLCVYNLNTNQIEKVIHFPDQTVDSASYYNVKKIDNLVIIIPAFERQIYVYDTIQDMLSSFNLPVAKYQCEKFLFCSVWDQNIYLFPVGYEHVIKINLRKRKVDIVNVVDNTCKRFVAMTQIDETVYLVNESNKIYVFNMLQERFKIIACKDSFRRYRTITHRGKNELILSDVEGNVYQQYLDNSYCEDKYISGSIPFDSSQCVGDFIFLLPIYEKDYFVRVNINTKELIKIHISKGNNYLKWPHTVFSKAVFLDDNLYFFSTQYRMLFSYNVKTEKEITYQLEMPIMKDKEIEEMLRQKSNQGPIKEGTGQYATLEKFILLSKKDRLNEVENGSIGNQIFRKIQG